MGDSKALDSATLGMKLGAYVALGPIASPVAAITEYIWKSIRDGNIEFINLAIEEGCPPCAERGLTLSDLENNDVLRRTVLAASMSAAKTGSQEKRARLRNAIKNAMLDPEKWRANEPELQRAFDICSEVQFVMLEAIRTRLDVIPDRQSQLLTLGSTDAEFEDAYLRDERSLKDLNLLFAEGLIRRAGVAPPLFLRRSRESVSFADQQKRWTQDLSDELSRYLRMDGSPHEECVPTKLGVELLRFVSEPE